MIGKVGLWRMYSTTILLTPGYSLGFCAGMYMALQIGTGIIIASMYNGTSSGAFSSVDSIMRDTDAGMIMRSMHANGASMMMAMIYGHMIRSMWHGSGGTRVGVWLVGVVIYIMTCAACLTGYSLVYGQMSLWAIVVISSMVTAIPWIGKEVLELIWGGSVVSTATLGRFFAVHFLVPMIIGMMVIIHIWLLHNINSTGETGMVIVRSDRVNMLPQIMVRDVFIIGIVMIIYGYYVYMDSNALGHADNYVPANAMVTPIAIAPEWYFLPFYGVIRAIPHKVIGIMVMLGMLIGLTNIGEIGGMRWNGVGDNISGGKSITRVMMWIWVIDIVMASKICMMVNGAEAYYWLLVGNVMGMFMTELITSGAVWGKKEREVNSKNSR